MKLHLGDPQVLDDTTQNLVALTTRRLQFVHPELES